MVVFIILRFVESQVCQYIYRVSQKKFLMEIKMTCKDTFQVTSNQSRWWWKKQIAGGQDYRSMFPYPLQFEIT